MTVASETARSGPYVGNGSTTVFAYTFRILDEAHLTVIKTAVDGADTTLTLTTDYTVSGVGDAAGGNVTMVTAPAAGEKITILRGVPLTQGTDWQNQGPFYAETVEDAVDKLTMAVQQLSERVDRALLLSESSSVAGMTMPDPVSGRVLVGNAAGTGYDSAAPNSQTYITLPNPSVDNTIVRFDGTTGGVLQGSGVTIDDNDGIRMPAPGFAVDQGGLHRLRAVAYSSGIGFQRLAGGGFRIDENVDADGSFTSPRRFLEAVSNWNKSEIDGTYFPMPVGETDGIGDDGTVIWNTNQLNFTSTNRLRVGGADLTPTISGGVIQSVAVDSSPSTYPTSPAPRIAVIDTGGGTGAVLTANIVSGAVDSVTVNNGGSGYTSNTALVCAPPSTDSPLDVGPQINLIRDTFGPAGSTLGWIFFAGRSDSGTVDTVYASIGARVKDPTFASPAGTFTIATASAFSVNAGNKPRFDISDEGLREASLGWPGEGKINIKGLQVSNTEVLDDSGRLIAPVVYASDDGASADPTVILRRVSASPAPGDNLGRIFWQGSNTTAETVTGLELGAIWDAATDGAESMSMRLRTINAGSFATRLNVGAGFYMQGAIGGDKGSGTVNATGVYDDNTLLTCYVLEGWLDGSINVDRWDDVVPDREGEERAHERARGFASVLDDRLDTEKLIAWVKENRRLPAFPGPDHWRDRHNSKMAAGDVLQRLWETAELQIVHLAKIHERLKALESNAAGDRDA